MMLGFISASGRYVIHFSKPYWANKSKVAACF